MTNFSKQLAVSGQQGRRGITLLTAYCLLLTLLAACSKSPFERSRDASGAGATGAMGSGNFVVFSNELKTGGGAFLFPGGDNQTLTFEDTSNPISTRSIRYTWTGGLVGGQVIFAGFDLMHTPTLATYDTTTGKDLRAAGYTKVTFFARGGLSSANVVKFEAAEPSTAKPCITLSMDGTDSGASCTNLGVLTSNWKQYSISVPNAALSGVKDLFKATIIFNQPVGSTAAGQGGTIYVDQVQYEP